MNSFWAIVKKEFIHILRDSRTLVLILLMPLIQLTIYGYGINTDVKHISTVLLDEDQTALTRRLKNAFEQSAYFNIELVHSLPELRRAIDRGKAQAGIHIPPDFTKNLLAKRNSTLQMLIDGTDSTPANVALNTGSAIVNSFIQQERLIPIQVLPIDYRARLWYNPDLKSSFFMIPGLVGLLLQLIIPMITATAIVREKERGNIEQLLVTPIKSHELILGKLVPYVVIGLFMTTMILVAAHFLFHVPVRGSLIDLYLMILLFLVCCLGIGLFASTVADNQQQAAQIVMFFASPSILLSGFIFPREAMPLPIHVLGYAIPLTFFLKIVRGIILKGLGIGDLWPQIIPLTAIGILILGFSILKFHKRLA